MYVRVTCKFGEQVLHMRVAWYACMTRGARTDHLYAWRTRGHVRVAWYACMIRGTRVARLICLYDTWCTCGSLVVLVGHVVLVQCQGILVVT